MSVIGIISGIGMLTLLLLPLAVACVLLLRPE